MQFSQRVTYLQAEGAYAVLARARELERQGQHIIHLEIGQPDFETPSAVCQSSIDAIHAGFTRYSPPAGLPELRQVIATDSGQRRGMTFQPSQVVIGPGAKPALLFAALALIDPGDEVMYPDPGFPTYLATIQLAGGVPVPIPLREEKQFSFDLEQFAERISDRTKVIILNSPGNPTGGVVPQSDLAQIAELSLRHDCWIISDEIYSSFCYDDISAPSIAALPGMAERTAIVDGFSKTFAMTGWRLGYGIMPLELAKRVELLTTHAVGCTATFTQIAGVTALTGDRSQVEQVTKAYQQRRDRIVSGLNSIAGIVCQVPQGAFYVFPNVKALGIPVEDLAHHLLTEAGVAVLPGTDFGANGEGYLRLCYATGLEEIELALERIEQWVERKLPTNRKGE
jgi:aspartate aminotransferase